MAKPNRIRDSAQIWRPGRGLDPAAYLVDPGSVTAPGRHSAGGLFHARPYLVNGAKMFVFPVGTEGFRRSGQASLSLHRYIAAHHIDGRTMHYEEGRIELRGTFPGLTSQQNMVDCIHVLTSVSPERGITLYAPGVFDREQYVLAETWDFNHDPEDRTHSIDFTLAFVRISTGALVKDPHGKPPPPQPLRKTEPRGWSHQTFVVKDGARTFQSIAAIVYHNSGLWMRLADKNQTLIRKTKIPQHKIPTHRWPIGTSVAF